MDSALRELEMAMGTRRGENLAGLIHHSDRVVQYPAEFRPPTITR